jgi:hypothetical protein
MGYSSTSMLPTQIWADIALNNYWLLTSTCSARLHKLVQLRLLWPPR